MSMYDKLRRDIRISKGYTNSNPWVPDWSGGMKKVLYVNGCSHTRGTELAMEGRLDLTWPNLLAKHLEFNLINDSTLGASNDRIFRTTIEYILSAAIPPDKVVIQFTEPERFEINNKSINPRSKNLPENFLPFINEHFKLDDLRSNISMGYSHKLLNQIYSLQNIFKEYYIDDYTFLIWRKVDHNYITYKIMDKNKIIFDVALKLNQKYTLCKTPDPFRNNIPDHHFGADAHDEIFKWIRFGKSMIEKIEKSEEYAQNSY
jgi:hypothetical protein